MPVTYVVDRERRLVRATASGTMASDDFLPYLEALEAEGLIAWPQIVDAREAVIRITPEDVRRFVFLIDGLRARHGHSRTAFVTRDDSTYGMLRMYAALGEATDPGFAVFRSEAEAEAWVASRVPPP
ncbi:MAG TPA: hypothetical protein VFT04_07110 [Gemmatimonadales bacterium]|nr:hypothetical protein [Gemmatimonadales bacterium]